MAEAVVIRHGHDRFHAFSAATDPAPEPNPLTLELLEQGGYSTQGLRSKYGANSTHPDLPAFDFVFTLSDTASRASIPGLARQTSIIALALSRSGQGGRR